MSALQHYLGHKNIMHTVRYTELSSERFAKLGLARIYMQEGKIENALPLFTNEIANAPNVHERAEAAYSAGEIQFALNKTDEAHTLMLQGTTLDPTYPLGWIGLGQITFNAAIATSSTLTNTQRSDLMSQSIQSLLKGVTLDPHQSAGYYQLGIEYAAFKQYSAAQKFLQEAASSVPNDISLNAPDKQAFLLRIKAALSTVTESMQ